MRSRRSPITIEVSFLNTRVVLFLHDEAIATHGGTPGIRDHALLESALSRPANKRAYGDAYAIDIFDLAASYAFALVKSHAFLDGNKRIGWAAAVAFLLRNGIAITVSEPEVLSTVLQLATGELTEDGLAMWLRALPAADSRITAPVS